jgi:hypothetical protein
MFPQRGLGPTIFKSVGIATEDIVIEPRAPYNLVAWGYKWKAEGAEILSKITRARAALDKAGAV